jgi:Tfp pilus assembly protein PilF
MRPIVLSCLLACARSAEVEVSPTGSVPTFQERLVRGNQLLKQAPEQARAEFVEALKLDPTHPLPHLTVGVSYAEQGRWAEADEHYARSIAIQPNSFHAQWNRGIAALGVHDLMKATTCFKAVVEAQPTNLRGWMQLGGVAIRRFDSGKDRKDAFEEAVNALEMAIDIGRYGVS